MGVEVKKACESSFKQTALLYNINLPAIEFGVDHVHIFVTDCKNYSVSQLVKLFKGRSSRFLRKNYNHKLKKLLWGKSLWSSGYFYRSVGSTTSKSIGPGSRLIRITYDIKATAENNVHEIEVRDPLPKNKNV